MFQENMLSGRNKRIENECEREIPRLHRILLTPYASHSLSPWSSSSSSPDVSSESTTPSEKSPPYEANKENEAPRSNDATGDVDYNRYGAFSTPKFSEKPWMKEEPLEPRAFGIHGNSRKRLSAATDEEGCGWYTDFSVTYVHATVPPEEREMPLGDLDSSTLSTEQKVIKRPAPKPSVDVSQFPRSTDPFNENVPIPIPAASYTFFDVPKGTSFLPSSNNDVVGTRTSWRGANTAASLVQFKSSLDMGLASFVAVTYPDEIVELHRRRIYPSSTEPDWCVGETIEYVRRQDLYPYEVVKPVIRMSTVELAAPRPVGINRYPDTQKWLRGLARELATD